MGGGTAVAMAVGGVLAAISAFAVIGGGLTISALSSREVIVVLLGVQLAVQMFSIVAAFFKKGAPFETTGSQKIQFIFGSGGLLEPVCSFEQRSLQHLMDLGSGEGAVVRAAVRQGGFGRATGIEINPALVALSRVRSLLRLPSERFRLQCMWTADVSDVDVIFVYGLSPIMERLGTKLATELPAGAHIVSNAFPFLGTPGLVKVDQRLVEGSGMVFMYRVDKQKACQ
jgi:hypothetical protein